MNEIYQIVTGLRQSQLLHSAVDRIERPMSKTALFKAVEQFRKGAFSNPHRLSEYTSRVGMVEEKNQRAFERIDRQIDFLREGIPRELRWLLDELKDKQRERNRKRLECDYAGVRGDYPVGAEHEERNRVWSGR